MRLGIGGYFKTDFYLEKSCQKTGWDASETDLIVEIVCLRDRLTNIKYVQISKQKVLELTQTISSCNETFFIYMGFNHKEFQFQNCRFF